VLRWPLARWQPPSQLEFSAPLRAAKVGQVGCLAAGRLEARPGGLGRVGAASGKPSAASPGSRVAAWKWRRKRLLGFISARSAGFLLALAGGWDGKLAAPVGWLAGWRI